MDYAGRGDNFGETPMSSVRCSMRVLNSVHDFFLLEEGLGYGLVVPFPAYGFAALVSHNEVLNARSFDEVVVEHTHVSILLLAGTPLRG